MIDVTATRQGVLQELEACGCQRWIEKDQLINGGWVLSVRPDNPNAACFYIELDGQDYADVQCGAGNYEHPHQWNREAILDFVEAVCAGRVLETSIQTPHGKRLMTKTRVHSKTGELESNRHHLPLALVPLPLFLGQLKIVERTFTAYKDAIGKH
jgi:hypothetical protein